MLNCECSLCWRLSGVLKADAGSNGTVLGRVGRESIVRRTVAESSTLKSFSALAILSAEMEMVLFDPAVEKDAEKDATNSNGSRAVEAFLAGMPFITEIWGFWTVSPLSAWYVSLLSFESLAYTLPLLAAKPRNELNSFRDGFSNRTPAVTFKLFGALSLLSSAATGADAIASAFRCSGPLMTPVDVARSTPNGTC